MKRLILCFFCAMATVAVPGQEKNVKVDTTVAQSAMLKNIELKHEELTRVFQGTLTAEQRDLQDRIKECIATYRVIKSIAQDSIKIKNIQQ